jgi:hypothetical protein
MQYLAKVPSENDPRNFHYIEKQRQEQYVPSAYRQGPVEANPPERNFRSNRGVRQEAGGMGDILGGGLARQAS